MVHGRLDTHHPGGAAHRSQVKRDPASPALSHRPSAVSFFLNLQIAIDPHSVNPSIMMRLALQLGTRQARQATTRARPAMVSVLRQQQGRYYRGMNRIEDMSAAHAN